MNHGTYSLIPYNFIYVISILGIKKTIKPEALNGVFIRFLG